MRFFRVMMGVCAVTSLALGLPGAARAQAPAGSAGAWMAGTWTGIGAQQGTGSSWTIRLTVAPAGAGYSWKIDYPSLGCGGAWTPTGAGADSATFVEHITYGREKCLDLGTITVHLTRRDANGAVAHDLAFHWTGIQPGGRQDTADATLTRE